MWDMIVKWTLGATLWDWIWHTIAVVLVVLFSVPQIWWPRVQKRFFNKNKDSHDEQQINESQS